jgi:hypothetical protein
MRRGARLWIDLPDFERELPDFERELPDFGGFERAFVDFGPFAFDLGPEFDLTRRDGSSSSCPRPDLT